MLPSQVWNSCWTITHACGPVIGSPSQLSIEKLHLGNKFGNSEPNATVTPRLTPSVDYSSWYTILSYSWLECDFQQRFNTILLLLYYYYIIIILLYYYYIIIILLYYYYIIIILLLYYYYIIIILSLYYHYYYIIFDNEISISRSIFRNFLNWDAINSKVFLMLYVQFVQLLFHSWGRVCDRVIAELTAAFWQNYFDRIPGHQAV